MPVTVRLRVRRFFCDQKACNQAIFAEPLPGVAARYGRRTERLDGWFTHVSFALGGEAGSRLLKDLGVVVSGETLLNHIRSSRLRAHRTPKVLSVDDFAFRRGTRYGTILVDLERRTLVDVLPDRSADTFARWLVEHPGVEIVSRDRGGEYAEAALRAVPHAVQVADRFHLLKNLQGRCSSGIQAAHRSPGSGSDSGPTSPKADELPSGSQSFEGTHERADTKALPLHPHPFKERHKERTDRPDPRNTPPHRGEVPGLQDSSRKTSLHQESQRHRPIRGLHPEALEAGVS